jgi:prephenate dehydrogenase
MAMGAIDRAASNAAEAVRDADWVVLCTPVGLFESLLNEISPVLKSGAIVTDVGSTKRSVVKSAEEQLPATAHFIGSHPMAGSEKRGIEFAKADLFNGAVCITTPTAQTNPSALQTVEQLWRSSGMKVIRMSPEQHDQRVAMISHLPHAVAAALVAIQDSQSMELAGKGFTDTTRIAAGDPGLWRDILIDNADQVRQGIRQLGGQLQQLDEMLAAGKSEELMKWLAQAVEARQKLNSREPN